MTSRALLGFAVAFLALVTAGCDKNSEAPTSTTTQASTATSSNPPIITAEGETIDLAQMSRDVRRWILKNQRPPKDFDDYAATAQVKLPQPPPGKKFAITKQMNVILVDR